MSTSIVKTFNTLQARAALIGATVVRIEGDTGLPVYVLTCGPLTQQLNSMEALGLAIDFESVVAGDSGGVSHHNEAPYTLICEPQVLPVMEVPS